MKITKSRLKQIVKEELQNLNEGEDPDLQAFDAFMDLPADSRLPTGKIAADGPDDDLPSLYKPKDPAREELLGYLMEDGIDVNMNSHLSNEQLDAILKISRAQPGAGMGGMSRNEYMWDKTAKAFPEEYEGQENPFRGPDPRKTAELRQQTRAQGGYSGKGAWKPRE